MSIRKHPLFQKACQIIRRLTGVRSIGMPRVLLVDDDKDICEIVGGFLESEGFSVKSISSPPEIMSTIRDWKPHAVLLDIMMPEVDGFEVLHSLRREPRREIIDVYMMTSLQLMDDVEKALSLGAAGYFVKPVKLRELSERLRES